MKTKNFKGVDNSILYNYNHYYKRVNMKDFCDILNSTYELKKYFNNTDIWMFNMLKIDLKLKLKWYNFYEA